MPTGYITSRADTSIAETGTRVDIRPDNATKRDEKSSDFFGADGLSFRDVLDAINPLNHIPIVSDLFAKATDHKPSTASRLAGGALLGGPLGFVASLANVIFESATGSSPTEAAYAALTGNESAPVQGAAANSAKPANIAATVSGPEDLSQAASLAPGVPQQIASAVLPQLPTTPAVLSAKDRAVLDLYGASASAHDSYKKAQLLPYLRDVNHSRVL